MKLGLLKDIKKGEYRVILTPAEISAVVRDGHEAFVEHVEEGREGAGERPASPPALKTANTSPRARRSARRRRFTRPAIS